MASTKEHPAYELLYWPDIPGRGEFIRLAFEAAGVPYKDTANESKDGINALLPLISPSSPGTGTNPPILAPPALRIPNAGKNNTDLLLYQTPSILSYLGDKLHLAGSNEAEKSWILSHTLTALDLNNEVHDSHHPVSSRLHYEDQKTEALRRAQELREYRIPKFLGFFERVLAFNEAQGGGGGAAGTFLVGEKLSYADLTVWHVLSGLFYAFPREMEARKGEFPVLTGTFFEGVKEQEGVKAYLASGRRKPFGMGIFRRYSELDRQ